METLVRAIEIFAALTGVAYVVLEILQKNAMWYVGILTGAACAFSFAVTQVWASMALNIYYVGMSVVGLWQWKKDADVSPELEIRYRRPSLKVLLASLALLVCGVALLSPLLARTGDPAPLPDAFVTVLSAIATWWLAKSYLQQWLLWIVADAVTSALCIYTGQYAMALMYLAYMASAVIGYIHWKTKGNGI